MTCDNGGEDNSYEIESSLDDLHYDLEFLGENTAAAKDDLENVLGDLSNLKEYLSNEDNTKVGEFENRLKTAKVGLDDLNNIINDLNAFNPSPR